MIKPIHCFSIIAAIGLISVTASANQSAIAIPQVKLTSHGGNNKKQTASVAATQISAQKIRKSPVTDLRQLLKQEQSVVRLANTSGDATQPALSLRGFGDNAASNSLILIDGFPLTNPSTLSPDFNSIPLTDIERIDIIQGSQGSLWGDQAVGGVVNIITRHPNKLFSSAIFGAGSFNKHYFNVLAGDKAASGLFFKTFAQAGGTDNYREHSNDRGKNGSVTAGMDYASGSISLNVQKNSETTYFPGGLTQQQYDSNPRQASNFSNYSHYDLSVFRLLSRQELTDNWLLETRLSREITNGDGYVFLNFNRADYTTRLSPRLLGRIDGSKVTLGYDGQDTRYLLSNDKLHSTVSAAQHSVYLQTVIPVREKIDVTLGGRYARQTNLIEARAGQRVNSLDQVFVSEEGVSYRPADAWSLFLRRDGNFSFPKANENIMLPGDEQSLAVETGVSYEAGTEWHNEQQRYQLSVYRLELKNEIAFDPTQTEWRPFGSYSNLDRTLRHGVTLTGSYRMTARAALDGQINVVRARFAAGPYEGNTIPAVPAVNGNLGLDYALNEQWQARYALLYTGGSYASQDVANEGKRVPGYWLHDVSLQYQYKCAILSFEVANILNRQYSTYTYYDPGTHANTYYPAAGRNYSLTLKLNID